jgi:hypothetical protein
MIAGSSLLVFTMKLSENKVSRLQSWFIRQAISGTNRFFHSVIGKNGRILFVRKGGAKRKENTPEFLTQD